MRTEIPSGHVDAGYGGVYSAEATLTTPEMSTHNAG
jgi:hypothetical protein